MKVFRHKNGNLYTIEQVGRGRTIIPPRDWKCYYANPYKTNKAAPLLSTLSEEPNLQDFTLEFEE